MARLTQLQVKHITQKLENKVQELYLQSPEQILSRKLHDEAQEFRKGGIVKAISKMSVTECRKVMSKVATAGYQTTIYTVVPKTVAYKTHILPKLKTLQASAKTESDLAYKIRQGFAKEAGAVLDSAIMSGSDVDLVELIAAFMDK
jgi:hypothetical protein